MKSEVFFWMWCISCRSSVTGHDFYVINWVLALLSWWTFAVWRWWCFGFFNARLLNPFSSGCDGFRTAPVWWTLIFMALPDFSSVKKKCCFSGGHLFWLPVAFMIKAKFYFECDAIRTAPVRRTMFYYDINWDLAFPSRWRFWVCKVVFFCFLPCKTVKSFFFFWMWCNSYHTRPLFSVRLLSFGSAFSLTSWIFRKTLLLVARFSHNLAKISF